MIARYDSPFFQEDFAAWLETLPQEQWEIICEPLLAIVSLYLADRQQEQSEHQLS